MKAISLWELLTRHACNRWNVRSGYKVVIPIIQRDYAQGREGKDELREIFLKDIHEALTQKRTLKLDFVYGNTELKNNTWIFYPLDGQQRLTTLWLVHWYLAYRAKAGEEERKVLNRFSYETRYSSRVFCEQLCHMIGQLPHDSGAVDAYIRSRCWFFASYEQDPTITGMLRTLADIEKKFRGCDAQALGNYWNCLKGYAAPIVFYMTVVGQDEKLPLTDDLYIKMNARGKRLTNFENFKADLLKYRVEGTRIGQIGGSADATASFSHHLDTDWTDIFWEFRSPERDIDKIWMRFFNRYFLCWYIAHAGEHTELSTNALYDKFVAKDGGEKDFDYYDLAPYKELILERKDCLEDFYHIMNGLVGLCQGLKKTDITALFCPPWGKQSEQGGFVNQKIFSFIPAYDGEKPLPIQWAERVVFWGICLFLKKALPGEASLNNKLRDWVRFVWNMAENSATDADNAVKLMRFLSRMEGHAAGIETYLADDEACAEVGGSLKESWKPLMDLLQYEERHAIRQLHEEIIKARQKEKKEFPWKCCLEAAETDAFFKGAIAFLFMGKSGYLGDEAAWKLFFKKWHTARRIFDKDGLVSSQAENVLRVFYSCCTNHQLIAGKHIHGTLLSMWRDNICLREESQNYMFATSLHAVLSDADVQADKESFSAFLSQREVVQSILSQQGKWFYIKADYDAHFKLYPFSKPDEGVYLEGNVRDEMIAGLLQSGKVSLLPSADSWKQVWKDAPQPGESPRLLCVWGRNVDLIYTRKMSETGSEEVHLRWRTLRHDDASAHPAWNRIRLLHADDNSETDVYEDVEAGKQIGIDELESIVNSLSSPTTA